MKILVACFLLSAFSITIGTPTSYSTNGDDLLKFLSEYNKGNFGLPSKLKTPKEGQEMSALLQALVSTENSEESDDDDDDGSDEDIVTLQGVFNIMAAIETEKAKTMEDAMIQFWKAIGRTLWRAGKRYLRRRHCSEELEVKALLQELTNEQGGPQDDDDSTGDDKALAELQSVFKVLKKAEAKAMQDGDDNAKAEGWWSRLKRWGRKTIRRATRRYLC